MTILYLPGIAGDAGVSPALQQLVDDGRRVVIPSEKSMPTKTTTRRRWPKAAPIRRSPVAMSRRSRENCNTVRRPFWAKAFESTCWRKSLAPPEAG